MKKEQIIKAWDQMNPDDATKERIFQRLTDRRSAKSSAGSFSFLRRLAICAAALALFLGSSCLAYATVPSFRQLVHSILFPRYTAEDMVAIDAGHMTGSFDERDVLLTFLDQFNQKKWENDITAKFERGYSYELYRENDHALIAFVDSAEQGTVIVVRMEKTDYEETTGLWQVRGYQAIERGDAEVWKTELQPYEGEN